MRIARIASLSGTVHAVPDGERWQPVSDPFAAFAAGAAPAPVGAPVDSPTLLAPVEPRVVVGIAQPEHPDGPVGAWLKSPRTVVAGEEDVVLRRDAGRPVIEGEVAVVIGRSTVGLTAENAASYVLGATAVNDVSSPERPDPRNFEVKGGPGYTPLGPWIETAVDLDRIELAVRVDGIERVRTGTHELPAPVARCLAYVAHWIDLGPGDVVMTGAPRSAFPIDPGALVEIDVAGARLRTRFL